MKDLEQTALSALSNWTELVPDSILGMPPIDIESLGSYWGVQRIVKRQLKIPGLLYRVDTNRSVVFVKDDDSPGRQRFTCSHEFGHIIMAGNDSPQHYCRKGNQIDRNLERCCDIIAAEILMPRKLFRSAADQYGWTLGAIRKITQQFQVTASAAAIRLLELANEPLLMSAWGANSNPLLKLKLRWSRPNDLAKALRPDVRWKNGADSLPPLYQAFAEKGVTLGHSKVLMRLDGESQYQWVATEGLGVGTGAKRTVLGFHYLLRQA